ncbi:MAG: sirohydrochlorin ferrochelatase [Lentimonas sp.]|jgi:sirohydrochlorin ferrochelatase
MLCDLYYFEMTTYPCIFLIDNGSLRAEAVLALRALAAQLSDQVGLRVEPVSLLHSSKVPASALGGVPAQVVKPTLRRFIEAGERRFVLLPLFLGPSRAITDYLPELIAEARELAPDLDVVVADALAGVDVDHPDVRLAEMLAAHVRQAIQDSGLVAPRVAMVDHGTPAEAVNCVRNAVARQLAELLSGEVAAVEPCSMERREGAVYDFNEPLLERVDQLDGWSGSDVVVALFFLLPGRHAGAAGDVAQICDGLIAHQSVRSTVFTSLLYEHLLLVELLADRLRAALGEFVERT